MWYAIQTLGKEEDKTIAMIEAILDSGIYDRCLYPSRRMKRRWHGVWREVTEKIVPGYIFVMTDEPLKVYSELKKVPKGENFIRLSDNEVRWLTILVDKTEGNGEAEVALSQVGFTEGDEVVIMDGPLTDLTGYVKKINLHKRQAELEVEMMGRKMIIYLGIDIVDKIDNTENQ